MRRSLLLIVILLFGMGLLVSGMSISGFMIHEVYADFEAGDFVELQMDTEFGIEAGLRGWTFGTFIDLEEDGWEDLEFFTSGSFGAFDVFSWYEFYAINGDDLVDTRVRQDWDTVIQTKLGGVDLYGAFSLGPIEVDEDVYEYGFGAALGLHADIGAFEFWGEISSNLAPFTRWIVWNGMDMVLSKIQACDPVEVIDPVCSTEFTFANAFLEFPFCCADVGAEIAIDCEGFFFLRTWAEDVGTGLDWLTIDVVDLNFIPEAKMIDMSLVLSFGEIGCITPFGGLDLTGPYIVDGIYFDGLELVCPVGDVTAIAAMLLDDTEFFIGTDGRIHSYDYGATHGYLFFPECASRVDAGESFDVDFALGLETTWGGCCGSRRIGIYTFFGPGTVPTLFSWRELRFYFEDEINERFSWRMVVIADDDEFEGVEFTINYRWGDPWLVSPVESCCGFFWSWF